MKVTLKLKDGGSRKVSVPYEGCPHAVAEGDCPGCGEADFLVAGQGMHISGHDTYAADAHCLRCKTRVGVLEVRVNTIFGLEEDERVLRGRPRVY